MRVLRGEIPPIKFFNVIDDNQFCCGLLVENECLLYSTGITKQLVYLTAKGLEFNKFRRYEFFGTKGIIDSLFNTYNVEYSEQKYRKYYECTNVIEPFHYTEGYATMGEMVRFHELVQLSKKFHNEFYENDKKTVNVEKIIYSGIENRNIYQWIYNNQLVGMAQVIYNNFDFPVIGHVFTHPDFRGKGIASSLTHTITKGLIEHGHKRCWLMTNAYNPASNKAFQKVGYLLIGEYVVRYKEK